MKIARGNRPGGLPGPRATNSIRRHYTTEPAWDRGAIRAGRVVLGLGGAAVLTPALKPVLYGVSATDAPTFVLVPLLLVLVACVAAFLPARRAALLDPLRALRQP